MNSVSMYPSLVSFKQLPQKSLASSETINTTSETGKNDSKTSKSTKFAIGAGLTALAAVGMYLVSKKIPKPEQLFEKEIIPALEKSFGKVRYCDKLHEADVISNMKMKVQELPDASACYLHRLNKEGILDLFGKYNLKIPKDFLNSKDGVVSMIFDKNNNMLYSEPVICNELDKGLSGMFEKHIFLELK